MTLAPIPGWNYPMTLTVYFCKRPDAELTTAELRDLLCMPFSLPAIHTHMRAALQAGVIAKRRRQADRRLVVWHIGPVLARRLAS